jgi:tetratricopeptide (TPR) repeat protein
LEGRNRPVLQAWREAHGYFRDLSLACIEVSGEGPYLEALRTFERVPAFLARDPFLAGSYWEKKAEFHYAKGSGRPGEEALGSLRNAVRYGPPAAHLQLKLGSLYLRKRRWVEAKEAFRAGLAIEPSDPSLQAALSLLGTLEAQDAKAVPRP